MCGFCGLPVALARESEQKPDKWQQLRGSSTSGATVMHNKPSKGTLTVACHAQLAQPMHAASLLLVHVIPGCLYQDAYMCFPSTVYCM